MHPLAPLLPFVRRYWRFYALGLSAALLATLATASIPWLIGRAVDGINTRGVDQAELLRYGGLLLLAALASSIVSFGQRIWIGRASYLVETDLREMMFNKLLSFDQGFYGEMHTGDLMARVTNDISAIRMFLGPGINSLAGAGLLIIAAAGLMLGVNIVIGLMVLALLPAVVLIFVVIGARMRKIFRKVQDQFGVVSTRAQENFSGIRTIKAYAQEEAEVESFRTVNEAYRKENLRYVLLSGLLWPLIGMVLGLIGALVVLVGGQQVAAGTMTLGSLVLFNAYLAQLGWPMIALGWTVDLYQQAAASMTRLNEVQQRRPQIASPRAPVVATLVGDVEFRDVGVRYDQPKDAHGVATPQRADAWMLRDISFRVPRGTTLAIVGATGAGKTTLVNLLARVRDPDAGQVLLDGHDVRALALPDLRAAVGYVPQDTFLFSVPLRDNVTFGRTDAPEEAVQRAVTISRLVGDLEQLPDGIATLIGERGVTLSGGQKQRTAIARAVLRDPVVLVLDDALSSVDTHTASEILSGLRTILQEKTGIIIAQRIATVRDADQIIVLHDGRVAERGSHRALLAAGGRYAAMYRRELLQSEMEE